MRMLTQLRIDEVSAVIKGSNPGAKVLIRKSDEPLMFDDIIRKADVSDPLRGPRDEDDDNKVPAKLRAWARMMVTVDPSKSEEDHLFALIHTARGQHTARHLNELSKGETMPQVDIFKLSNLESVVEICKHVVEKDDLSEFDLTKILMGYAKTSGASFERLLAVPEVQAALQVAKGFAPPGAAPRLPGVAYTHDQLLRKAAAAPLIDVKPAVIDTGDHATESDADRAVAQLTALVNEIRRTAPFLTDEQLGLAWPGWKSAATRGVTRKASTEIDASVEIDDPETAYTKLMEEAEGLALKGNITVQQAFAKLYEQNTELAKLAARHQVLERAAS